MLEPMAQTMSEEMSVNLNERKENDDSDYCVRVCFFFCFFFVSGQIFRVAVLFCLNA